MQTRTLPENPDARSPAGAEIRYLMEGAAGNMIHSTVPPGQVNRATVHATVTELWHVLSGRGEIWRRDECGDAVTALEPGVSIDIPVGTAFQYRCTGNVPLVFTCTALPPWPGDDEAVIVDGPWVPRVDPEPGGENVRDCGLGQAASASRASRRSSRSMRSRSPTSGAGSSDAGARWSTLTVSSVCRQP